MVQYSFGSGNLYAIDSVTGKSVQFGALQDVSIDFSFTEKQLRGQFSFPLDVARADGSISIKAASGVIDVDLYNSVFFGLSVTTGARAAAFGEAGTIPATPFQITPANAATFYLDLGVYDTLTGVPLTKVASAPTTGQYSVNATTGVYTFAAADTTKAVKISYLYSVTGTGKTLAVTNTLMGTIPTFRLISANTFKGKQEGFDFKATSCTKLSMPRKRDDYLIPDLEFGAYDNGAGALFDMWQSG